MTNIDNEKAIDEAVKNVGAPGDENDGRSENPPVAPIATTGSPATAPSGGEAGEETNPDVGVAASDETSESPSDVKLPDPTEVGEAG